jgi:hypothetical protein
MSAYPDVITPESPMKWNFITKCVDAFLFWFKSDDNNGHHIRAKNVVAKNETRIARPVYIYFFFP